MKPKFIISLVFYFLVFNETKGQSCPFGDNGEMCILNVVTARSGLIMRDTPDRAGNKIISIPSGAEVWMDEFYYGPPEEIEGVSDIWRRISYSDKVGYVFGGFIKEVEKPEYKLIIPDSGIESMWEYMNFDTSRSWYALQPKVGSAYQSRGNENVLLRNYNLSKINLKEKVRQSASPEKQFYPADMPEAPEAIVSGLYELKQDGWGLWMSDELFPGKVFYTILYNEQSQEHFHYTLWATGTMHRNEHKSIFPLDSISSYEVWLRKEAHRGAPENQPYSFEQQLLYRGTIKAGKYDRLLSPFRVFFMGEIDGDGKLDLIIGNPNRGSHFQLYLSKEALQGFLLRMVADYLDFGD